MVYLYYTIGFVQYGTAQISNCFLERDIVCLDLPRRYINLTPVLFQCCEMTTLDLVNGTSVVNETEHAVTLQSNDCAIHATTHHYDDGYEIPTL